MEVTQKTNATQEQSTARDNRGTITSALKKVLFSPSRPYPRKNGKNSNGTGGETDKSTRPSGGFDMGNMFGGGGFGMGSSDVKLQYIDDNASSYSNIWNNAKTDITAADQNRLIASLKQLSSYQNVNQVVDVDAVIRYFVVHNFVCNGDSYTGSMIHNYYLYEENGQLSMLPWDYNLAYGTFQGGNAQSTVNTPIDTPVSGGGSDRPMWYWIASDEKYLAQYHQYYEEFLNTVDIAGIIENAYNLIRDYVAKDPTAFYTYEEFETGVAAMRRFCELRSESIRQQLANGTTAEQIDYADASGLNTSDMGSMGGRGGGKMPGGDFGSSRGDRGSRTETPDTSTETESAAVEAMPMVFYNNAVDMSLTAKSTGGIVSLASGNGGGSFSFGGGQMPPEGFDPGSMPEGGFAFGGGQMPEGFDPSTIPGGGSFPGEGSFPGGQMPDGGMFPGGSAQGGSPQGGNAQSGSASGNTQSSNRIPSGMSVMGGFASSGISASNWILTAVSIVVLAIGLVIAKKYRA
ncbi:MAG: CotH kinase family protein [Clostridia bacterium]|nr:CotH kinase family protein [Clostridia bacterium]